MGVGKERNGKEKLMTEAEQGMTVKKRRSLVKKLGRAANKERS
jgi:hypothetical protein